MLATRVTLPRLSATRLGLTRSLAQARWASQTTGPNEPQTPHTTITKETTTITNPSGAVTETSETVEATTTSTAAESRWSDGIMDAIEPDTFNAFRKHASKTNTRNVTDTFNMSGNDSNPLTSFNVLAELNLDSTPHHIHVNTSPNNTLITLTRPNGSPLITTSGGSAGFKKAARSGYEAAHQAALQLLEKINTKNLKIHNVNIILKGFGAGRDAAYKALVTAPWNIKRVTDATPVPFGGCRPKKQRRL